MKEQHRSKVTVYKQLVKVLQEEMDNMKQYWEGTAMVGNKQISYDCIYTVGSYPCMQGMVLGGGGICFPPRTDQSILKPGF